MARFTIYPFTCTIAGPATLTFDQLKNMGLTLNTQQMAHIPGGAVDVACNYMSNAAPEATFTTHDLAKFFGACGPGSVVPFTAGTAYMIERDLSGALANTGSSWAIAKGTIVPRSLSANQNDVEGAGLQMAMVILDDGTNAPIVRASVASMSALSIPPACNSRFYMGPTYFNSVQVPNIESTSIDFGVNYDAKGFNGNPYPTEGSIVTRRPSISLTTTAMAVDHALDPFMRSAGGAIDVYFQKGSPGTDRVAAATAEHIKISATAGTVTSDSVNVQDNNDGTMTLTITPYGQLSVSTTSTIP